MAVMVDVPYFAVYLFINEQLEHAQSFIRVPERAAEVQSCHIH